MPRKSNKKKKKIEFIAFDADDTLWENEPKYRNAEKIYKDILSKYVPESVILEELLKTELKNLPICGYGSKSFCMAMLETAMKITGCSISSRELLQIYETTKSLLEHPIKVFEGVEKTLELITRQYPIALITKGDMVEQERKLLASGLIDKFDFVEIVKEKDEKSYLDLIEKYEIKPENFMMVGNSLKSDILPVLKIGGYAVYIPISLELMWRYERIDEKHIEGFNKFIKLNKFSELSEILL